ncbi:AN1-type zinc finger protein 2A [Mycena kentingensis (nom. inval.)]|nr:AN1-type zinc finger protein 2A [Mycena kentingensis (nom. inval.)]
MATTDDTPRDAHILSVGKQCKHSHCNLVDFLPFNCQHCGDSFCQEHFKGRCPLMPQIRCCQVQSRLSKLPLVQRRRFVMTGRSAKATTKPICASNGCSKTLFARIVCDSCQKQFCPTHRHPSDHRCTATAASAPRANTRPGALTAGSRLLDLNNKASVAGAKTVGAIKAAASNASRSAAAATASSSKSLTTSPSSSSGTKPNILPAGFTKTDRASSSPPSSPKLTILSSPEPVIQPLSKRSFVPPPIFASA